MDNRAETYTATDRSTATATPTITRRIGQTTYTVNIYFNPASRETLNDKIIRMVFLKKALQTIGFY